MKGNSNNFSFADTPSGKVSSLYYNTFRTAPDVEPLPGAGSDRRYFRLRSTGKEDVIGTYGNDVAENKSFVGLARVFREQGVNVPDVFAVSDSYDCYLQSDLGDVQLLSLLASDRRIELAKEAMKSLVSLQTINRELWEDKVICKPFSRRLVMWDLNYFKYEFLKPSGVIFDEEKLEDEFEILCGDVLNMDSRLVGFMYRDCQSRNVMVKDGELYWIDFQGGREGPMIYDAVSFLWQAKAGFTDTERSELLSVYVEKLSEKTGAELDNIYRSVRPFVMLRTMQVLGAYGFRGLVEKKAHFIESIPQGIRNFAESLDGRFPELAKVAAQLMESRFMNEAPSEGLTVSVFSFSYKKGYPEDLSGNGGGFIFDCRGMHNPGRYDEYKPLTGMDAPVVEFLESRGEVQKFVDGALALVTPSVETYIRRGFSGLQVGFGCTGGRHRSVYCAERFAQLLKERFPGVKVRIIHREGPYVLTACGPQSRTESSD